MHHGIEQRSSITGVELGLLAGVIPCLLKLEVTSKSCHLCSHLNKEELDKVILSVPKLFILSFYVTGRAMEGLIFKLVSLNHDATCSRFILLYERP